MTIGPTELAILALLICGVCFTPAPAFFWHHTGRWLVFSMSLMVMLGCVVGCGVQYVCRKLSV